MRCSEENHSCFLPGSAQLENGSVNLSGAQDLMATLVDKNPNDKIFRITMEKAKSMMQEGEKDVAIGLGMLLAARKEMENAARAEMSSDSQRRQAEKLNLTHQIQKGYVDVKVKMIFLVQI